MSNFRYINLTNKRFGKLTVIERDLTVKPSRNTRENILFRAIYTIKGPSYGYIEFHTVRSIFAKKYNLNGGGITECLQGKRKTHKGWKLQYILTECQGGGEEHDR